jgi:hypothetical protein
MGEQVTDLSGDVNPGAQGVHSCLSRPYPEEAQSVYEFNLARPLLHSDTCLFSELYVPVVQAVQEPASYVELIVPEEHV